MTNVVSEFPGSRRTEKLTVINEWLCLHDTTYSFPESVFYLLITITFWIRTMEIEAKCIYDHVISLLKSCGYESPPYLIFGLNRALFLDRSAMKNVLIHSKKTCEAHYVFCY